MGNYNKSFRHYKEWLSELPEPYRTQALDNLNPHMDVKHVEITHVRSMSEAISNGIKQWQATPQGFDYWRDAYNKFSPNKDYHMKEIREPDVMPKCRVYGSHRGNYPGYMPKVYSVRNISTNL